jgi:hypothetical protein
VPAQPIQYEKGTDEARTYVFDFTAQAEIAAGQTLSAPVVSIVTPSTPTTPALTIASTAVSGSTITVKLGAGANATRYLVKCVAATSGGSTLSAFGALLVQDPT